MITKTRGRKHANPINSFYSGKDYRCVIAASKCFKMKINT